MPEPIERWWARRQSSKATAVPYPIGRYRDAWRAYPVLARQYHPEFNAGITLSQIPPAADVFVLWECDAGHRFVATPDEQRSRPGRARRASTWCPVCSELATARPATPLPASELSRYRCGHPCDARLLWADRSSPCPLCDALRSAGRSREQLLELAVPAERERLGRESATAARYRWRCPRGHPPYRASVGRVLSAPACPVCRHAEAGAEGRAVGEAFVSRWAPAPASAAEPELRARLQSRLEVDLRPNAVRVAKAFHGHLEVWPDIVLAEFKVAVEYDTVGRHGLEHVGTRERSDRRKDRLLRAAGWEVIRVRIAPLRELGPNDLVAHGVTDRVADTVVERLELLRGALLVAAYLKRGGALDASPQPAEQPIPRNGEREPGGRDRADRAQIPHEQVR